MIQGLGEVLKNPQLKFILALNFCNYACTFTVQGLWGGPFLREVHGLTPVQSGNVLLIAVIAYQIGMLIISPLDRVFDNLVGNAVKYIWRADEKGNAVGHGYQEYNCSSPQPGWIEQSLDEVWAGICSATKQAVAKADLPAEAYHSVGLSSQRGTFGLLDENRRPLIVCIQSPCR